MANSKLFTVKTCCRDTHNSNILKCLNFHVVIFFFVVDEAKITVTQVLNGVDTITDSVGRKAKDNGKKLPKHY